MLAEPTHKVLVQDERIVRLFLGKGLLLERPALDLLRELPEPDIQNLASKPWAGDIVRATDLEAVLRPAPAAEYGILSPPVVKTPPTPEAQLAFFASRYERMKRVFTDRLAKAWVSAANVPSRGDIWLLGIVRDLQETEAGKVVLDLEDPTGSRSVLFDSRPDCSLDDIIAVRASAAAGRLYGKELLWPDVPLRAPSRGSGSGCFVSDLHLEEAPAQETHRFFEWLRRQDLDWLFVAGDTGDLSAFESLLPSRLPTFLVPGPADTTEPYPQQPLKVSNKAIIPLPNPATIEVGGLRILMAHAFRQQMLRKRHMGPAAELTTEDTLCIEAVPDIVHHGHDHKPFVSNYKSITTVNSGSPLATFRPVVIDFASRELRQVIV